MQLKLNYILNGVKIKADDLDFELSVTKTETPEKYVIQLKTAISKAKQKDFSGPYIFEIKIKGVFNFSKEIEQEKKLEMILLNGTSIVYGLIGGFLLQTTANFRYGKLLLPTVNFVKFFEERTKDE